MQLKNKTIVITGGTSGIGYQMVKILCVENTVIVISRQGEKMDLLKKQEKRIEAVVLDLSQPANYESVAKQLLRRFPVIDVLINNAAIQHTPYFLDKHFIFDSILQEIHVNFAAVCSFSYLLLPALLQSQHRSYIVNINSGLALTPKSGSAVYCATKAAMNSLSQSLNYQLEQTNVEVLQAFLPLVETSMTAGRGSGKISAYYAAEQVLEGIKSGTKVNNVGKVKLLRLLLALSPFLAKKVMRRY